MKIDKVSSERLSLMRFPLIVGVVFIHAYKTEVCLSTGLVGVANSSYLSDLLRNFISQGIAQTSVPLFFLMSGYFFFLDFSWSVENYKGKIKSRINTLLIPFLFWNIFTLFLFALAQYLPATQVFFSGINDPISTFGTYDYANAIFGIDRRPISYQFWFIRDLIVMALLTPGIYLIINGIPKLFYVGIFALWFFKLWPVYVPSVTAFAFFYAGAYFAYSNISLFALDRFGVVILFSYSVILLIDTFTKGYEASKYIHNTGVLLGVASMLFLSKTIVGWNKGKRALLWAGSSSFFVFAVHEPLLMVVRKFIYKVIAPSNDVFVLLLYFFIPVLIIISSILLYVSIRSIAPKLLSMISGGRSHQSFVKAARYEGCDDLHKGMLCGSSTGHQTMNMRGVLKQPPPGVKDTEEA